MRWRAVLTRGYQDRPARPRLTYTAWVTIPRDDETLEVILVEFGRLTPEQQMLIDGHPQRALGADMPTLPVDGGLVVAFAVDGEATPHEAYEDIRGWSIGHALPIRRLV